VSGDPLREAAAAADRREWSAAADLLRAAVKTDDVLDKLGWYLSLAKRYDEAIQVFTELRQRRPDDYRPPYMIGFQLYQQQRWRESLDWFDDALRRRPDHIKSLWRRANALYRLGEDTKAVLAAGRVLQLWHELPPARQEQERKLLAKASYLLGRYQLAKDPRWAVDLLAQAAANDPQDAYKHYLLAKALRRAGRNRDALAPASEARNLKAGDVSIELEYAEAVHAAGRSDEAASTIRRLSRRCSGWTAYRAGALALRTGDARLAVALLRRAMQDRATRGDQRIQQALAEAVSLVGDLPTAVQKRKDAEDAGGDTRRSRRRRRGTGAQPHHARGTVDLVKPERGFGFLVDDAGVRRHFRLRQQMHLAKGQQVTFVQSKTEKGPTAQDVRPA